MGFWKVKKSRLIAEKHPQIFVKFGEDSTILFLTKDLYTEEQLEKIKEALDHFGKEKLWTMLPSEYFKRIVMLDCKGVREVIYDDEGNYNFVRKNKEVIINEN